MIIEVVHAVGTPCQESYIGPSVGVFVTACILLGCYSWFFMVKSGLIRKLGPTYQNHLM